MGWQMDGLQYDGPFGPAAEVTAVHTTLGAVRCRGACGNTYIREEQLADLLGHVVQRIENLPKTPIFFIRSSLSQNDVGSLIPCSRTALSIAEVFVPLTLSRSTCSLRERKWKALVETRIEHAAPYTLSIWHNDGGGS
jgi:hypothetical protein